MSPRRDEKITPPKLAGILLGFAGVAAMTDPRAVVGLGGDFVAVAAMLAATFSYGLCGNLSDGVSAASIRSSRRPASSPPRRLCSCRSSFCYDHPFGLPFPGIAAASSVAGLALLSTALAYVIFFALITRAGGTNTMLVTLLIPVGGVFLAWALLGEAVDRPPRPPA